MMIGCEFHPRFQQIASVDPETGECGAHRLNHPDQAEQFYRSLAGRPVRMGAEATGNFRWFRQLMQELGHEFLLGDPSAIRAASPRRQKTDKRDARHILSMLVEDRFPAVWQPPVENEDPRQLLLPRSTPASKDRLPGAPVSAPTTTAFTARPVNAASFCAAARASQLMRLTRPSRSSTTTQTPLIAPSLRI